MAGRGGGGGVQQGCVRVGVSESRKGWDGMGGQWSQAADAEGYGDADAEAITLSGVCSGRHTHPIFSRARLLGCLIVPLRFSRRRATREESREKAMKLPASMGSIARWLSSHSSIWSGGSQTWASLR